jgi:hypothetical protein
MTLQDYINGVANYVPTAPTLSQTVLISAINSARNRVLLDTGALNQIYSTTLQGGLNTYPFPSINGLQVSSIFKVWIYIGTMQVPLRREKIDYNPLTTIQQYPYAWWTQLDTIYFYPTPATNIATDWYVGITRIPPLVNLTDTETLPQEYWDAVQACAARQTALADGNMQLASAYDGEYKYYLNQLNLYKK